MEARAYMGTSVSRCSFRNILLFSNTLFDKFQTGNNVDAAIDPFINCLNQIAQAFVRCSIQVQSNWGSYLSRVDLAGATYLYKYVKSYVFKIHS